MARDPRAFLWDALNSAGHIQRFVEHRSLEDYVGARLLWSAVEREFEVIGEALNQLACVAPECPFEKKSGEIKKLRRKPFFSEEKNQKTFITAAARPLWLWLIGRGPALRTKVFLP